MYWTCETASNHHHHHHHLKSALNLAVQCWFACADYAHGHDWWFWQSLTPVWHEFSHRKARIKRYVWRIWVKWASETASNRYHHHLKKALNLAVEWCILTYCSGANTSQRFDEGGVRRGLQLQKRQKHASICICYILCSRPWGLPQLIP